MMKAVDAKSGALWSGWAGVCGCQALCRSGQALLYNFLTC